MAYVRGSNSSHNNNGMDQQQQYYLQSIVQEQLHSPDVLKRQEHERILLLTNNKVSGDDDDKNSNDNGTKPLSIFGIDISFLSPPFRYFVLACGMFFFMCLYGYFQELVVYGWFQRKLSIFSTFLHFLGSSVFAQLQYNCSKTGRAKAAAAAMSKSDSRDSRDDGELEGGGRHSGSTGSTEKGSGSGGGSGNGSGGCCITVDTTRHPPDQGTSCGLVPLPVYVYRRLARWVQGGALSVRLYTGTCGGWVGCEVAVVMLW